MLSQTTEYALRAGVYLARNHPHPQTAQQVATGTRVSAPYVSKVLHALARASVVVSRRGVGGGFVLARSPEETCLLDVVDAVEPIPRIRTCPLQIVGHGAHLCPLHRRLDAILAETETAFRETTLAQILAEPTPSTPLCPFPTARPECTQHAEATGPESPK